MWGDELCDKAYNFKIGQLIAIKGVKVSEFGGKSLNMAASSNIFTDLDNKDAKRVKAWYAQK
jgi:replication factor A1